MRGTKWSQKTGHIGEFDNHHFPPYANHIVMNEYRKTYSNEQKRMAGAIWISDLRSIN